jgi:ATP-dependent RNA helicase DDX3X
MTDDDNQLIIASATWSEEVKDAAEELLATDHWRIQLGRPGRWHANVEHKFIEVEGNEKKKALFELLDGQETPMRTIIFCNSKMMASKVDDFLHRLGFPCTLLSGDMSQLERQDAV